MVTASIVLLFVGTLFVSWIVWLVVGKSHAAVKAIVSLVFLGIVLVGLMVPAITLTRVESSMERAPVAMDHVTPPTPPAPAGEPIEYVVWTDETEELFDASLYSSDKLAIRFLARKLGDLIKEELEQTENSFDKVRLESVDRNGTMLAQLESELSSRFPKLQFPRHSLSSGEDVSDAVSITLRETDKTKSGTTLQGIQLLWDQGKFNATFRSNDTTRTFYANYVDKPWVNHFETFSTQYGQNVDVGRSATLASSMQAAEQDAMNRAILSLRSQGFSQSWIDQARAEGRLVIDQFVQRLSKPYGDVWRAALLIDTSPETRDVIANQVAVEVREVTTGRQQLIVGAVFLALLVIGLYAILNSLTKGYYREGITIVLGLLVLGGLALLIA